ncbi:MAG TPA: carboxypeptidase-like regulatory domain-containing protein [Pyrinomonadaceae bacterium]
MAVLLCAPAFTLGQDTTLGGRLTLRVKGPDGPIEGASVVVRQKSQGVIVSTTDADGSCRFNLMNRGTYAVEITSPSYFVSSDSMARLAAVEVQPPSSQFIDVSMLKGGAISGRLSDLNSFPLVGVPVTALLVDSDSRSSYMPPRNESNVTAFSDDQGRFRVFGLRPGKYAIGINTQRAAAEYRSLPPVYYPGERDVFNASLFEVNLGTETKVPDFAISLTDQTAASLLITVVDSAGKSLEGASVSLKKLDGGNLADSSLTDLAGHANFDGLPPGKYLLKANVNNGGYFGSEAELAIQTRAADNYTVVLRSYPRLSGRVLLRTAGSLKPLPFFKFELISASGPQRFSFEADDQGAFRQPLPAVGSFRLAFPALPGDQYVQSVKLGAVAAGSERLHITRDLDDISIIVADAAAAISGAIEGRSARACSDHQVFAIRQNENSAAESLVAKGSCVDGSFAIASLPPGRYYVVSLPTTIQGSATTTAADNQQLFFASVVRELRARRLADFTLAAGEHKRGAIAIELSSTPQLRPN